MKTTQRQDTRNRVTGLCTRCHRTGAVEVVGLVCDRFGLNPDDVHYIWGDTDKVAYGHGTGGSRSATLGGSALHMAANKIVEKATKLSAHSDACRHR